MSVLKPEMSLMASLAVATVVYATYNNALPPIADARTAQPGNHDLDSAERSAAWISAGVVSAVSLMTRDINIFIIGGAMVIGMSWWHRHANMVNPEIGKAVAQFHNPQTAVDAAAQQTAETYDGSYQTSS